MKATCLLYVACVRVLCAFMCGDDKDGDSIHSPARSTDCWIVQAVLSAAGRLLIHSTQEYSSISPTKTCIHKTLLCGDGF